MVSTEIRKKLERCCGEMQKQKINVHEFEGPLEELAYELVSAESFLYGIAERLCTGKKRTVNERELKALKKVMCQEARWFGSNGIAYDVANDRLLKYAIDIEALRILCLEAIADVK